MKKFIRKILSTILIVVIALGTAIGGWFLYRNFFSQASTTDPIVKITQPGENLTKGETFKAEITMENIKGYKIQGAHLKLNYPEEFLSAAVSFDGDLTIDKTVNDPEPKNGVIEAEFRSVPPFEGDSGVIMHIDFTALKDTAPSDNNVYFDEAETKLFEYLAEGTDPNGKRYQDILDGNTEGAKYTIGDEGGTLPGDAVLSLSPASATKEINESFNLDINLDTGNEDVIGAIVYLTYNEDNFDVELKTDATDFDDIISDNQDGVISFSAIKTDGSIKKSDALVAKLTVEGKQAVTPTVPNFIFDKTKCVVNKYTETGPENIIGEPKNGTYTIGDDDINITAPNAPTNLKGTAGNTVIKWAWESGEKALSFAATSLAATTVTDKIAGYRVYLATVSGQYNDEPVYDGQDSEFIATGLTNGQEYFAVVEAYGETGTVSDRSKEASATPSGDLSSDFDDPSTGGIFQMPSALVATGIVFGVIILIALGVALVLYFVSKKKKNKK